MLYQENEYQFLESFIFTKFHHHSFDVIFNAVLKVCSKLQYDRTGKQPYFMKVHTVIDEYTCVYCKGIDGLVFDMNSNKELPITGCISLTESEDGTFLNRGQCRCVLRLIHKEFKS